MSDEEDDSMAANPEPPHITTGYSKRKQEQHGEWVMRFEARAPERPQPKVTEKFCKQCNAKVDVLHSIHPEIRRLWCGKCQGDSNRARMEGRQWP